MFPHDPDDEDLFTTSARTRTSSATFLSKLSSKVRHPSRTDLNTLQQVSIKGLLNGFPCWIASSMHAGCCEIFGKRKNRRAAGETVKGILCTRLIYLRLKTTDFWATYDFS